MRDPTRQYELKRRSSSPRPTLLIIRYFIFNKDGRQPSWYLLVLAQLSVLVCGSSLGEPAQDDLLLQDLQLVHDTEDLDGEGQSLTTDGSSLPAAMRQNP